MPPAPLRPLSPRGNRPDGDIEEALQDLGVLGQDVQMPAGRFLRIDATAYGGAFD